MLLVLPRFANAQTSTGTISVDMSPAGLAGSGFTVSDQKGNTGHWGYNVQPSPLPWSLNSLPLGTYTVTFDSVSGYTVSPASQTVTLSTSAPSAQVRGAYAQTPTIGTISVSMNIGNGRYYINQSATSGGALVVGDTIGSGTQTLPFGAYLVTFNSVSGYTTPAAQTVTLSSSSPSTTVNAEYKVVTTCQSPKVMYQGQCVATNPPCKTPIANSASCTDYIEYGQYIEHYSFSCLSGFVKSGDRCAAQDSSTTLPIQADSFPACKNPPLNVMPSSCIDKIENGVRIERYSFSCLPGYEKKSGMCVNTCREPQVSFNGVCTDPIPACENPPANSTSCIDKIVGTERIRHYYFSCLSGFEKVGDACLKKGAQPTNQVEPPTSADTNDESVDEQEIAEGQPDLTIKVAKATLVSRTLRGGIRKKQYKFGVTVKNDGDGDAEGPFYVTFSNSAKGTPVLVTKGTLEAGKMKKVFVYVETTEKGKKLLFTVDPDNAVDESDEGDNTATRVVGK